jgi:hypothetical protein
MADHEGEPLVALVAKLQTRLGELEDRVAALEALRSGRAREQTARTEEDVAPRLPALAPGGTALAGRTLLVLAGAYLFRALTDAGVLHPLAGATLGLLYAGFWLLCADRDGAAGRRASALVHAAASSAVAFPLIWEATARFGWLGARGAGGLVLAFAASGLLVARRRRLPANAWVATLGACGAVLGVLLSTHDPLVALVVLLALGGLVEWLAYHDAWLGLRWWTAAASDAAAGLLIAVAVSPDPPPSYGAIEPRQAAAALLGLPVLFLASIAARTLRRGCPVRPFEVVQGILAVALGVFGARRVLFAHGVETPGPALVAVTLAALGYLAAFAHAERRAGQGRNFYFYSTAGGLLMLAGTLELGPGAVRPLAWAALGATAALLGRRFDRTTLRAHGAAYLTAAAIASGLAVAGARALAGLEADALGATAWAVAAGAALAWAALASEGSAGPATTRVPRLVLAVLVVLALAEGGGRLAAATPLAAEPAARALAASAVAAALALGAALLARRGQPELAWLAYPLALLPAGKLLLPELPAGRPATLVASLGLCGALLLTLPRLLRTRERTG